jgi:hypothetical protein
MDERPRVIATFSSYAEMLDAIRQRVNELNVSGECLDAYLGIPRGLFSKIAGVRPIRRLGMLSFSPVLNGLGLKCQFVEDEAATARLKNRVPPRDLRFVRAAPRIMLTDRQWRRIQKLGRTARWQKLSAEQRSEIMRAVALRRWQKANP